MRDVRKFTVLSFSCYKNTEDCFMLLFNHALNNNLGPQGQLTFEEKKKAIEDWANTPTDEDFTALHFATYHGNY
jgi:hypothetical protein